MMLVMLASLALTLFTHDTGEFARPSHCPLERSLSEAEVVVFGKIEEVVVARSHLLEGKAWYRFRVTEVYRGNVQSGQALSVLCNSNWTCESRSREYAEGEEMLLLLRLGQNGKWRSVCGFQSEWVSSSGLFVQSHLPASEAWRVRELLEGLPELVAYTSKRRSIKFELEALAVLLRSENPEIQRFAMRRLDRTYEARRAPFEQRVEILAEIQRLADTGQLLVHSAAHRAYSTLWRSLEAEGQARGPARALEARRSTSACKNWRDLTRCALVAKLTESPENFLALSKGESHSGLFDALHEQVVKSKLAQPSSGPLAPRIREILAEHPRHASCAGSLDRLLEAL